jgi:phage shock protein C
MNTQIKRLFRSRQDRMIGGVCGGLGDYFGIDPTLVRLLFVFGTLMGFQGLLAYLVLLIVVPEGSQAAELDPGTVGSESI